MLQNREHIEIPIDSRYGKITLYIDSLNSKAQLFEEETPYPGESRYQLQEGCIYSYELVGEGVGEFQIADNNNEIITHHKSSRHPSEGTISTGIYVGQLTLRIVRQDIAEEDDVAKITLEIRSTKADYESDYRRMLDDIAEYSTDLVLQQGSPVNQHLEIDDSCSSQTLYQRFSFIRSIIDSEAFSEAVHKIIANPVRKWTDTTIRRNIVAARRLTKSNIRQMISSVDRIPLSEKAQRGLSVPLTSVPRNIDVSYKCDTIDNQENQFVKFVLRSFSMFCADLRDKQHATDRLKDEAVRTIMQIDSYLDSQFFRQVSMPTHLNMNSPVLQRKEGYREVLQAWLMFDLAAKLNWEGGENVYEAGKKNVAALYEYWLFFKLMELVSEFFELNKKDISELVTCDSDMIDLDIKQGKMKVVHGKHQTFSRLLNVAFYYNRTFSKVSNDDNAIKKAGSWTMSMRPDYTLSLWPGNISEEEAEKEDLIVHIHFDAKYRLNKIALEDDTKNREELEDELNSEKNAQELGIYKRADLLKMHAYKDAIRRTSGAYVLYPGTENREIKGFHEIIPGLGAFCVRPGHWHDDSLYLKQFLSEVKAHLLDRTSEREKLSYYQYDVYKKPNANMVMESLPEPEGDNRDFLPDEINVIIGYCHKANIDFLTSDDHHFYNMRTEGRGGAQSIDIKKLTAKYIVLWNDEDGGWSQMFKLSKAGPRVISEKDFVGMGYKTTGILKKMEKGMNLEDAIQCTSLDGFYLLFKYDARNVLEKELQQYDWDLKRLSPKFGKAPQVMTLDKLMQFAVRK